MRLPRVPFLAVLGACLISCGFLTLMENLVGNWRAGFFLIGAGFLTWLAASILSRRTAVAYGLDSMDRAMGSRPPIPFGTNVGHMKPMAWEYDPQRVLVAEAWFTGPYCISKHHGKFFLVKNHTLLAMKDSLADAIEVAEVDRRES